MNRNTHRLDDTLNMAALATIVGIALSIGSAMVSIGADSRATETAQAVPTQTVASAHAQTGVTLAAAH
jgi:hypothetical protein